MPLVSTFCDFFGCSGGGGGGSAGTGNVTNLLMVDYQGDWQYLEGIEEVGFAFGADRVTAQTAPASGVWCKRASPTDNEIAFAAAAFGWEPTDLAFVVFAETLTQPDNQIIKPQIGDKIVAFDYDWVIKSFRTNVDFSQFRCYCRRSTK